MFLCAKTASAATAALGFSGYLLQALGLSGLVVPVAVAAIASLTPIVLMGIRRSNRANIVIVSVTVFALAFRDGRRPVSVGQGPAALDRFFRASAEGSGP